MQKANEVMKAEMQQRAKEKEDALKKVVEPLKVDGLNKGTFTKELIHFKRSGNISSKTLQALL